MMVDARLTLTQPDGGALEIGASTRFEYQVDRTDSTAEIGLDQLSLTIRQNGRAVQDSTMNRASFTARPRPDAPLVTIPYDKAPPGLQEMLGVFGTTIAKFTVDPADGKERSRALQVKGPLAATFSGLVDNIMSVHSRMPGDADRWESPARLTLPQGQSAKGVLTFEKVKPTAESASATVRVSGTLDAEGAIGQAVVKGGKYVVSGEQVYDHESKRWKSARWTVEVEYTLTDPEGKPTGVAKGPLTLTMAAPKDLPTSVDPAVEKAAGAAPPP
jgi:hypothetical protein